MTKVKIKYVILFALLMSSPPTFGQQQAAQPPQYGQEPTPITIHKISDHVYELRGGDGANCSFIIGERDVFAIDAKMNDQSAKDIITAIKKITEKPISHIIITHSDADHVNGLTGFPENIDIIAHANSAKHMETANKSGTEKIPLPNETFYSRMNIYSGKLRIDLLYFGPAHTDGDIIIHIPEDNVAIVGDLFFKDRDPLIHMHKNGTSFGLVEVLNKIIDLDAKTYMSGHAEPVIKADIENLRNSIIKKQSRVKAMMGEGKTLNDIKQAFGADSEQSRWRSLVEVIFLELNGEE